MKDKKITCPVCRGTGKKPQNRPKQGGEMPASDSHLSEQEVENCVPDLFDDFRKEAERHGMNDVDIRMAEGFIRDAYRRGLNDR